MNGAEQLRAFISGCASERLGADEIAFFRETRPCGLILFRRNCTAPDQIRRLIAAYRDAVGSAAAFILIDQEGGRVQRLAPPLWRQYPPALAYGRLYERDPQRGLEAARLGARLIARDLFELGITVNCAPVIDIPVPGSHDVIGDRAYASGPSAVTALGRAAAEGYLEGGVLPVVKHVPGHGRAGADSHKSLPKIECPYADLCETDFAPFRALSGLPLAMTAHVLIPVLDPDNPASASRRVIREAVRGEIGFDGFLMCDDIGMGALSGSMTDRARAVLDAGCDAALHCSGDLAEMEAAASSAPLLEGDRLRRFKAACGRLRPPEPFDEDRAEALLREASGLAAS